MTPRDWNGCEDDFYDQREGAGPIVWGVVALLIVIAFIAGGRAFAQEPPAQQGARTVTLAWPDFLDGGPVQFDAHIIDAIVRTQSPEYLVAEAARMMPRPRDFTVGRIEGGPGPSVLPAVRIGGRVVETATRVQCRADGTGLYVDGILSPTRPGYPKVFTWDVPARLHDGRRHTLTCRALRASGTTIGMLDNATPTQPFAFVIGDAGLAP